MKWAKQTGFTIVELLIVIVVIGILAGITIVAYSGIQNNAKDKQVVSIIEAYAKGLQLYAPENGGVYASTNTLCLDGSSTCWSGTSQADSTATANTLRPIMGSLPTISPYSIAFAYNPSLLSDPNFSGWYFAAVFNGSVCPQILNLIYINKSGSGPYTCRLGMPVSA